ncbi:hypothetical protein EVAR_57512_1 [Eumeta japonica]|uniref:Uncharacterized protein n=1 Tax=Eumeta variegata TaxID=151549 RepID=A0A4C1ZRY5_EUMVA|nr:hypothetical protein EVAR_57512_1 [Eumeta japonica]
MHHDNALRARGDGAQIGRCSLDRPYDGPPHLRNSRQKKNITIKPHLVFITRSNECPLNLRDRRPRRGGAGARHAGRKLATSFFVWRDPSMLSSGDAISAWIVYVECLKSKYRNRDVRERYGLKEDVVSDQNRISYVVVDCGGLGI